jgi:hypothetical protein
VDPGSRVFGSVVVDEKGRACYSAEAEVRNDVKPKMDWKRAFRMNRTCRLPRFDNCGSSRKDDRLTSTARSRLQAHQREILFMRKILPCGDSIFVEKARFDVAAVSSERNLRNWEYLRVPQYDSGR